MARSRAVVFALVALGAATAAAAPLRIDVDAGTRLRLVDPRLFGTNLEPKDQSDQAVRDLIDGLGLTLYRYPGGGWPGWHWRTGTFDNEPVYNGCALASVDYLAGFLAAVEGELLVQVNVETGTADEAAGMLAWMRAHGVPGEYFELGNEVYGDWDAGYRTSAAYVSTIQSFASALRATDSAVRVGADVGGPAYDTWDRAVVRGACADIDFLSFHWYPGRLATETPLHVMANSLAVPQLVGHFQQVLNDGCAARQGVIEIGFLEWDGVFDLDTTGMRQTLANAIFYADALGQMATSGVKVSAHYETAGRTYGLFDGYDSCFVWKDKFDGRVRPKALAIQLASELGGGDLVATTVTGVATYASVTQSPDWEYSGPVPYQAAYASRHADSLTLLLVSREPQSAVPARITLTGFEPQPTATVRTLTGPSLTASNEQAAGTVAVSTATIAVGPSFDFSVPPRSVVLLELTPRAPAQPVDAGVAPDAGGATDAGVAPDAAAAGDAAGVPDAPATVEPPDAGARPGGAVHGAAGQVTGGCNAGGGGPGLLALAVLAALRRRRLGAARRA